MSQIPRVFGIPNPLWGVTGVGPAKNDSLPERNATVALAMPVERPNNYTEVVISFAHAASTGQPIDWYSFLARPRLPEPSTESLVPLRDASILVTGAGGSIGSALSLQLNSLGARQLVLLDASEQALHRLQSTFRDAGLSTKPWLILANVTDQAHLDEIFQTHRPDLVFHAAAYKHVPLLEEFPLEALANNTLGTLTVAECARTLGDARLVLLSTDKAVAPASILGASKRLAEKVVLARSGVVVRLGNVLGTEGSVSETFLRQIAAGGPITLTGPGAERYFLTCEEAVDLLLRAAVFEPDGSLLVPQLDRQYRIANLAEFLIARYSTREKIEVIHTGPRAGDKVHETLHSSNEVAQMATTNGCVRIIQVAPAPPPAAYDLDRLKRAVNKRDLVAAMDIVREIVPDYSPSERMLTQIQQSVSGALQR